MWEFNALPWTAECSRNLDFQIFPKDPTTKVLRQSSVLTGQSCPQLLVPNGGRSPGALAAGCLGDMEDGRASRAQPKQNVAEVMSISRGWGGGRLRNWSQCSSVHPSWMLHKVALMAVQRWPSVVNSGPDKKIMQWQIANNRAVGGGNEP